MTKTLRKAAATLVTVAAASVAMVSKVAAQSYYTTTSGDYIPLSDAAAGTAFTGVFGLIWCCALCIPFIILLALAIFVYKDAEKNKVDNAALWAVLTFFTGIVGLLIYLLAIKPEAVKKNGGTPSTPTAI